ncbi:MAG: type III-B CRISPR-associated protein Cas10/Cmr2, partial [Spirulina sp.]
MSKEEKSAEKSIDIAIAWCLAWGEERTPQFHPSILQQMRQALQAEQETPEEVRSLVKRVRQLQGQGIPKGDFPKNIAQLKHDYSQLWQQKTRIGLVYGGATKIKQYIFAAAKLPDIRGASGLLDRINLIDLPAFFQGEESNELPQYQQAKNYCQQVREWLDREVNFPGLSSALIPELLIYSTGGNILAFCPAAFIDDLANAIEKRYTEETLTANSCAVSDTFRLLEIRFGLRQD